MFLKNTIYDLPKLRFIWVAFKQDIKNIILFTQLHIKTMLYDDGKSHPPSDSA